MYFKTSSVFSKMLRCIIEWNIQEYGKEKDAVLIQWEVIICIDEAMYKQIV